MELQEFCKGIGLMPEAAEKLNIIGLTEEEYADGRALFQSDKKAFYSTIAGKKDFRMQFLYYYCRMACEVYEQYCEKGIKENIYWDTFRDITFWCENCLKEFGEYGIDQYDWFFRHIEMKIFRFGRLEFEMMSSEWDLEYEGGKIRKGDPVINIHIPQGEKLNISACIKSCRRGREFWGEEYPCVCHSWLLYPWLTDVLKPGSNILEFQKLFRIVRIDYVEREAEWRIFTKIQENPKEYHEETSLQRSAKKYLLEGKKLGTGIGIWV